ncbi:MAG: trigger factor [Planctomycetaceae bacterium]
MSTQDAVETDAPEKPPLKLDVSIAIPQTCLREVVVTIPRGEVDRYLKEAFDELVPDAQVPGFRHGRAPRKLVEKQFKETIHERVKSSLVMDSLAQVTEGQGFSAIGEPQFDFDAVKLPDSGDFKFQFSIEVRPQFETPNWKGLKLKKPVEEISDKDVDEAVTRLLSRNAVMEATDEAAVANDRLLITAKFTDDGKFLSSMDEEYVTLADRVTFSDATCEEFGSVIAGVVEGDTRTVKVKLSENVEDESLRGKEVDAEIHIVEVLHKNVPEITPAFLQELGDFESEEEFRQFVRDSLERQAKYREQQAVRKAVVHLLTDSASFELPKELVRRQTSRELQRKILELRRSGFAEDEIRGYVNAIRQNAQAETEVALREHFILEQIAEELKLEATAEDYENEIELIAQQSGETPRKIRSRLEKSGQMDALRNQIVESQVIEAIIAEAEVTEEKLKSKANDKSEFAVFHNVIPTRGSDIPEAMHDDSSAPDTTKSASKTTSNS